MRVYPVGAISKGLAGETLAEMGELKEAGCVAVSDDGRPVMNAELMRRAMEYARTFGLTIVQHCEDLTLSARRGDERGHRVDARRDPRPARVGRVGDGRARHRAVRADGRALPRRAHQQRRFGAAGARGQAARAAGHLRGDAAPPDADRRGVRAATTPRPSATRRCARRRTSAALREALADGTIDAVATDHAPHSPVEKDVEFEQAAFGMIGLETALPLVLELVRAGRADAGRAGDAHERRAGRGVRAAGRDAGRRAPSRTSRSSIPKRPGPVDAVALRSRSRNTPFSGRTLRGRAALTVVGGTIAYSGERLT